MTVIASMRLDSYVTTMEHAMAAGPGLDPDLWCRNHDALQAEIRFAQALQSFRSEALGIAEEYVPKIKERR